MKRLLTLGLLALTACLNVAEIQDHPSDPAHEKFDPSTGVVITEMTKTADGVYYKDLEVGDGDELTTQTDVDIDYSGYLKNGYVFDVGHGVPISLTTSIAGLRLGMVGMRVNGTRKIVIPSALGYGPQARGPIPPNSTLIFDVRLLSLP